MVGVGLGCSEVDVVGVNVGAGVIKVGLDVGSRGGGVANGQTLCSGSFKSD
jgi:hypothetical protein